MAWCIVCGNPDRDPVRYGAGARLLYDDPEYGPREYEGVAVSTGGAAYHYFLVEVSQAEIERIRRAPRQGNGGRKYGGKDNEGPWYVSYNPAYPWPGVRGARPVLVPNPADSAGPRELDESLIDALQRTLDPCTSLEGDEPLDEADAPDSTCVESPGCLNGDVAALTSRFASCTACRDEHPDTLGDMWSPPRGWAGSSHAPMELPILVVSLNPGAPIGDLEPDLWQTEGISPGVCTPTQALALLNQATSFYDQGMTPFHKTSMAVVLACLRLLDPGASRADWKRHAWLTDLFKCSTRVEVGPRIPRKAIRRCAFDAPFGFLMQEVSRFKPRVIIAFGATAHRYLLGQPELRDRVVGFRHPSGAFWRLEDPNHDAAFATIAELLGVPLPAEFRRTRADCWREVYGGRGDRP